MPPSQLKRLKSSLREQGITGPPKSKKQKKAESKTGIDRAQRSAALQQIRDSFNPFEVKHASRPAKFDSSGGSYKDVLLRPGVSKSAGEEMRRATLLPEMQRRNKVGTLVDRRIGEGDARMTAEEKAVQRFAREKSRQKGANVFNLEGSDDDEPKISLTHGGRTIDDLEADDFGNDSEDISGSDDEEVLARKRPWGSDAEDEDGDDASDDQQPERKKSKKEVMKEVIAKSKLHKYERQKAKEDDEDLREQLDDGFQDVLALLRGHKVPPKPTEKPTESETNGSRGAPTMNPDRQKLLDGMDRKKVDKDYDARLKQLAQDARAKPSERTKTEEEKAVAEAARLKELEANRIRRMRGEEVSDDEDDAKTGAQAEADADFYNDDEAADEAAEFGFTSSTQAPKAKAEQLVLEDEDEFALDEDLIASGSDADLSDSSEGEDDSDGDIAGDADDDEEDEFVRGILGDDAAGPRQKTDGEPAALAYTYTCPRNHEELLDVLKDTPASGVATVIQRIRALYHPSLAAENKELMVDFSTALVEHLHYMGVNDLPLSSAEQIMRHLHSLSRSYPEAIGNAFRSQLQASYDRKDIDSGDLVVLTAIGSIYPTSDHFHQVVTPALSIMARWLGLNAPDTPAKHAKGAFLVALCLSYQRLSKRFLPEAVRFTLRALRANPTDTAHTTNLATMTTLYHASPAFTQAFSPFLPILARSKATNTPLGRQLRHQLTLSRHATRPLQLHKHRPLAIRTSIPKFEESFDPTKHYDPDAARSETRKLQQEYKREKKGAVRELRKDARFVAREQLREKKARDEAYERKYRRLVAEVQGEEGRETKEYEREKARRKRAKN